MPPHEAYQEALAARYTECEASTDNCPGVKRLVIALSIVSVVCMLEFLLTAFYYTRLGRARSLNGELVDTIRETKKALKAVVKNRDFQRQEVRRLQLTNTRYRVLHGRLPRAELEVVAAEAEHAPAYSPPRNGLLPENEHVFVVGSDDEEEDGGRAVDNAGAVETDPVAPRIATAVAVLNASNVPSEATSRLQSKTGDGHPV